MSNIARVFRSLKEKGSKWILLLAAVLLVLWPYFDFIHKLLAPVQVLGIAVGALTVLAFDVYGELRRIAPERFMEADHQAINVAVRSAFERHGEHCKHLRILACTTENILPAIRESNGKIGICEVILQKFDASSSDPKTKEMAAKVGGYAASWKALCRNGRIKELKICYREATPDFFAIIFDESSVVFGLFKPTSDEGHVLDFIEPVLVDGGTESAEKLIRKFIGHFEAINALCGNPVVVLP